MCTERPRPVLHHSRASILNEISRTRRGRCIEWALSRLGKNIFDAFAKAIGTMEKVRRKILRGVDLIICLVNSRLKKKKKKTKAESFRNSLSWNQI
jgi:hypothetical protein